MAPTPSPVLAHSPNRPIRRLLHHLRYLDFSHHPPRQLSVFHTELSKARTLDVASRPSVALEGPPPPLIPPTPSEPVALAPQPSAIPVGSNQPQGLSQSINVPGNIVAAVAVVVLILGGLIGLIVGGEMLRRGTRSTRQRASPPPSKFLRHRNSMPVKDMTGQPKQRTKTGREKFFDDEKKLTTPARPPPVLNRERQRRFSGVWPVRNLSRALCNRRSRPEQANRSLQHSSSIASPQTTWSEFSPVSSYVAISRTVLDCIPEEHEGCQSQTNDDITTVPGGPLQQPPESGSEAPTAQANEFKSSCNLLPDGFDGSAVVAKRCSLQDFQVIYEAGIGEADTKSLENLAPDMTSDGDESSRSSTASLESLEDENDRESLREEVFELKRAQTRSMQLNKGVLLSLNLKTFNDDQVLKSTHGECGPSRSPSGLDVDCKDYVEREMGLAILGGNFSAVDLDEFPSPPSTLPMIPSFVSGF